MLFRSCRPLPHHNVQFEIFQRRIQHLFHHAVQAVDLVDEEHVALFEVGEDGGQIARAGNGRPRGRTDGRAQLVGHHRGKGRLAQARRAREQDMVGHIAPALGRLDHNGERFFHLRLTQVVAKALRPQREVELQVVLSECGRHGPRARIRVPGRARIGVGDIPDTLYFNIVRHEILSTSQTFEGIL